MLAVGSKSTGTTRVERRAGFDRGKHDSENDPNDLGSLHNNKSSRHVEADVSFRALRTSSLSTSG